MQKCKICGAEIIFIPTSPVSHITCNAKKVDVITESGRHVLGYTIHKCAVKQDEKHE